MDEGYRRTGVAALVVGGAWSLIAAAGGGLVESCPDDLPSDRTISSSFLCNATGTVSERLGSTYRRPDGRGDCVMTKLAPAG